MVMFKTKPKRKRSFLGKYLDRHQISQIDLCRKYKLSKTTLSRACSKDYTPHYRTCQAIVRALQKEGFDCKVSDFFDV